MDTTMTFEIIYKGVPTGQFIRIEVSSGFYPGELFKTLVNIGYDNEIKMEDIYLHRVFGNIYTLKTYE